MSTHHHRRHARKGEVAACVAVLAGLAAAAGFMAWGGSRVADAAGLARACPPGPSLHTAL